MRVRWPQRKPMCAVEQSNATRHAEKVLTGRGIRFTDTNQ